MSIQGIKSPFEAFKQIESIVPKPSEKTEKGTNFGTMLNNAISEVDGLQKAADVESSGLILGKDGVTPHSAMIALQKADMAFQLMNAVRSKIVRAYEEIIRSQV